jgi:uncharacterized lipoprotein
MGNLIKSTLTIVGLSAVLSGCVLAPQTIELNETVEVPNATSEVQRGALIRVVDNRESIIAGDETRDYLGSRGGRFSERSPLLAQDELANILSLRLQDSIAQLGFGGTSPIDPVRVEMLINKFAYSCNDGFLVTSCSVKVRLGVTLMNGDTTFTKPYGLTETRRVAAAPVKEYNEKWVNDVVDRLWEYIFSDPELRGYLGV